MRTWVIAVVLACGSAKNTVESTGSGSGSGSDGTFATLGDALRANIPADARVIGFGELHARTDRPKLVTTLARFTADGLPAIADKLSDLVVETWIVDPHCGSAAVVATAKVETEMRRPVEVKNEIATLAEAARAAGVQPHAMRLTCDDYARVAPAGKDFQPEVMLDLTTRELGRIATEAVAHRDREPQHRPWIAVYGGAVHPARFPDAGVADWSYAKRVDDATHGHYVEIEIVEPELAELDPVSKKAPWFTLVDLARDGRVRAWRRGERSFVVILPRLP